MFLLKLGLRPLRQACWSQLSSALTVALLLFLGSFLFWFQGALEPVLEKINRDQVLTVYLSPKVPERDERSLQEKVTALVERDQKAGRIEVDYVGVRDFVENLKLHHPILSADLTDLGSEVQEIVPRYFAISGLIPETLVSELEGLQEIDEVTSSAHRFRYLSGAFSTLQWVTRVLLIGVLVALVTGLIHLARMNSYLHRDAISILRYWGAGFFVARIPGVFASSLVGLLGGGAAALAWWLVSSQLAEHLSSFSPALSALWQPGMVLGWAVMGIGILGGMVTGAFVKGTGREAR